MKQIHCVSVGRIIYCALLGTIFLNSCATSAGQAQFPQNYRAEHELDSLVLDLITWIGEHCDYRVEPFISAPPEVLFVSPEEEIMYEGRLIIMHDPVRGVYDINAGKVTLVRPWSKNDPYNVGTLLHELVHFVQYSSKQWDCWQETELEAYKLQELWLKQRGIDPHFNWMEIFLMSRCTQRNIHM